jgi:hypothetical protein
MSAWLDNLIAKKAPRFGDHPLAGWQPRTVAVQGLGPRLRATHCTTDRRATSRYGALTGDGDGVGTWG